MAGKSSFKSKKASAAAARHRLSNIASTTSSERQLVDLGHLRQRIGQAAVDQPPSHKGDVLLEDVKPGQRVFLNAYPVLDYPILFVPDLNNLQFFVDKLSPDVKTRKEAYFAMYSKLRSEVMSFEPTQLQAMAVGSVDCREQLARFMHKCEISEVLRQLCYDEPIPLIDVHKLVHGEHSQEGEQSSTKARKIGTPTTAHNSHAGVITHTDQSSSPRTPDDCQSYAIPWIIKGQRTDVFAGFPKDLRSPDRLVMNLRDILNVDGWLITSEAFLLEAVDLFKHRKNTCQSTLQQEYRETYQACARFIQQEGTVRSKNDWRNFITSCVHVNALRHVLYNKPLLGSLPGDNTLADDMINKLLHKIEYVSAQRTHEQGIAHKATAVGSYSDAGSEDGVDRKSETIDMSYEEFENMENIGICIEDCAGVPMVAITTGATLVQLLKRAEYVCQNDLAATKLYYAELTKICKTTRDDVIKLQDMAKIGIRQAVEAFSSWIDQCMYWCVLRRVLHGVPIPTKLNGLPVDGGQQLPGDDGTILYS